MPRLTNSDFIKAHHRLKQYWLELDARPYSRLTALEQWQLHDYFQPTKRLSDSQLRRHRALATANRSALPQQAGRALTKIDAAAAAAYSRSDPGDVQTVVAYGMVNPELDLQALADLLVDIARDGLAGAPRGVIEDRLDGISHQDPGEPSAAA
jgi:hypothetical protein